MSHLQPDTRIEPLRLTTLQGATLAVPSPAHRWVHLQFRRFAGCPICNLHLRTMAKRHDELVTAGVLEVALFHSERETMVPFQADLPFAVVADPQRVLYRQFGVEAGLRSVMNPRAWGGLVKGMFANHPMGPFTGEGGHLGLPADFLINGSGVIVHCKYGVHADDQWTVDEVLSLAR